MAIKIERADQPLHFYYPTYEPFDGLGDEAFSFGRRQIVERSYIMNATWYCHMAHLSLDWTIDNEDLAAGIRALDGRTHDEYPDGASGDHG